MKLFEILQINVAFSIFFIGATTTAAEANCAHSAMHWRFGTSTTVQWHVTEGSACSTSHTYPETIEKVTIIDPAANGTARISGTSRVTYAPKQGYKGNDQFSYDVTSNSKYLKAPGAIAHVIVQVRVD